MTLNPITTASSGTHDEMLTVQICKSSRIKVVFVVVVVVFLSLFVLLVHLT